MLQCMISSGKKAHPVKHPRFDCPEQEGYLNLWRTYGPGCGFWRTSYFSVMGSRRRQYNAMRLLRAAHAKRMQTLNVATDLISRCAGHHAAAGPVGGARLVDRERPADNRRVVLVGITQAGLDLLDGAWRGR